MKNTLFLMAIATCLTSCSKDDNNSISPSVPPTVITGPSDVVSLSDNNIQTYYEATGANVSFVVPNKDAKAISAYSLWSAGDTPDTDPQTWSVKGSTDNKTWVEIDSRKDINFCARNQEIAFEINKTQSYKYIKFEVQPKGGKKMRLAEVRFYEESPNSQWKDFTYPAIIFSDLASSSKGSKYYNQLVQDKKSYLQYHAREVAKILYHSDKDPMMDIRTVSYILKDYDGVSQKSGNPPHITIEYSTRHIENSYNQSLFKLDYETRGVLYHEMTHAFQHMPKGVGNYGDSKVCWSCIEGVADAVRIHAGFVDFKERKAGGDYRDGYKTTGFFIQWLTTKDPDAIRKFNESVRTLDPWSFDKAMKFIFGNEATIEGIWSEYQNALKTQ